MGKRTLGSRRLVAKGREQQKIQKSIRFEGDSGLHDLKVKETAASARHSKQISMIWGGRVWVWKKKGKKRGKHKRYQEVLNYRSRKYGGINAEHASQEHGQMLTEKKGIGGEKKKRGDLRSGDSHDRAN